MAGRYGPVDHRRHSRILVLSVVLAGLAGAVVPASEAAASFRQGRGGTHCATSTSYREGSAKRPTARCHRHRRPPVHVGACANARRMPTPSDLHAIRVATLCLVNRARALHGEAPLRANPRLERAAQSHSDSMALENYFDHVGPTGQTPLARMRAAGYIRGSRIGFEVGENIAFGTLWLATPRAIVHAWMMSPGHRANILDPRFRDTAIGVSPHPPVALAHGQRGAVYTQDFGVIVHARIAR